LVKNKKENKWQDHVLSQMRRSFNTIFLFLIVKFQQFFPSVWFPIDFFVSKRLVLYRFSSLFVLFDSVDLNQSHFP